MTDNWICYTCTEKYLFPLITSSVEKRRVVIGLPRPIFDYSKLCPHITCLVVVIEVSKCICCCIRKCEPCCLLCVKGVNGLVEFVIGVLMMY